jgi:hypothetical protein
MRSDTLGTFCRFHHRLDRCPRRSCRATRCVAPAASRSGVDLAVSPPFEAGGLRLIGTDPSTHRLSAKHGDVRVVVEQHEFDRGYACSRDKLMTARAVWDAVHVARAPHRSTCRAPDGQTHVGRPERAVSHWQPSVPIVGHDAVCEKTLVAATTLLTAPWSEPNMRLASPILANL